MDGARQVAGPLANGLGSEDDPEVIARRAESVLDDDAITGDSKRGCCLLDLLPVSGEMLYQTRVAKALGRTASEEVPDNGRSSFGLAETREVDHLITVEADTNARCERLATNGASRVGLLFPIHLRPGESTSWMELPKALLLQAPERTPEEGSDEQPSAGTSVRADVTTRR